jgi:hypothetical protein
MAGLFRVVCTNGLIVGTPSFKTHVRHVGDVVEKVAEGANALLGEAEKVLVAPSEWSQH